MVLNMHRSYTPGTSYCWKGRDDGPEAVRFHQIIQKADLRLGLRVSNAKHQFGFIGFATDEGVKRNQGRPGAMEGPKAIREALAKLPYNVENRAEMIDVGDILCDDGNLSTAQEAVGSIAARLIGQGIKPIIMGGGHEIAWASYLGIAEAYPKSSLAIVNFDAHYDLRPLENEGKGTSGTSFTQIHTHRKEHNLPFHYLCVGAQRYGNTKALFQKAKELNVSTIFAEEILNMGAEPIEKALDEVIEHHDHIYATICLDVFNASCAPGVSAPQPLGIMPWHLLAPLRKLARSGKVVCLDIAELSPPHDLNGMTAALAATLLCEYIHHSSICDWV